MTKDSNAPLKKNIVKQRKSPPWYNIQIGKLKQTAQKFKNKRQSTKLEEFHLIWQDILKTYKIIITQH